MRTRRSGFTLIELLVVISIIALLMAMLLPALGNAKASARTTVCQTNLHQIGIAYNQYRNEFKDYLPPGSPNFNDQSGWTFWWWDNNRVYDETLDMQGYFGTPNYITNQENPWNKLIVPSAVWTCPSGHRDLDYWGTDHSQRRGRGYGYNMDLLNYWYNYGGLGWSVPVRAQDKPIIILGDKNDSGWVGLLQNSEIWVPPGSAYDPAWGSYYMTAQRHQGVINYLFTDGRVTRLRLEQATDLNLWRWNRVIPP